MNGVPIVLPNSPSAAVVPIIQAINQKAKRNLLKLKDYIMGQRSSRATEPAPPAEAASAGLSPHLALGAGCYWGTEKYVVQDFQKRFPGSIKKATVGFMSPQEKPAIKNPSYKQVCTGASGHIEVLVVELHEPEKHFEELVRFFFQFHDPTTPNRQGNDRGFQYASWIFCGDEAQAAIATKVRADLQSILDAGGLRCFESKTVTTKVTNMSNFTKADKSHQEYLEKNPNGYCNHRIRFKQYPQLKQEPPQQEGDSKEDEQEQKTKD